MIKIAVLASGSGTNAENIAKYFRDSMLAEVSLIITDRQNAGVFNRAEELNIPCKYIPRKEFDQGEYALNILREHNVDFIALAGFLYLVPLSIISAYEGKIVNIHPALLPAYGGKGMYGSRVHEKVLANGDEQSGISIHYVNSKYDEGKLILQARCPVFEDDTIESLAERVHDLEYRYYPQCIEHIIENEI